MNCSYRMCLIFATVALGTFMSTSSAGIVNTALPSISRVIGEDLSNTKWIVASFLLTVSALLPTVGRLSDLYGSTRIYNLGFLIFVMGSACIGAANNLPTIIAFRILQAIGASALVSNNVAILSQSFPLEQRGKAIGWLVAVVGFGSMCGPALSGLILQFGSWRWLFWIDVPLGIIGGAMALLILPHQQFKAVKVSFDWLDSIHFAAIAICLVLALSQVSIWGLTDWRTLAIAAFAISLINWFVRQQRYSQTPLLDFKLLQNPALSISALTSFLSFVIAYFTLVLLPFYLDQVLNLSPSQIGILLTYYPITLALCSPVGGWLSDRYGAIKPLLLGTTFMGIGQLSMIFLSDISFRVFIILSLVIQGIGMGLFSAPNNTTIISAVPKESIGVGGSILAFVRVFGQVTGATLGVTLLQMGARNMEITDSQSFLVGYRLVFSVGLLISLTMIYLSFQLARNESNTYS